MTDVVSPVARHRSIHSGPSGAEDRLRPGTVEQEQPAGRAGVPEPERPGQPSDRAGVAPQQPQAARVVSALNLLDGSSESLTEASHAVQVRERYLTAHLAALRAGAAVLAIRGPRLVGVARPSGGPRNLWELIPAVAPELREWADFFAHSTARRWAVDEGRDLVTARDADDLLRQAQDFLHLVRTTLGLAGRSGPTLRLSPAVVQP